MPLPRRALLLLTLPLLTLAACTQETEPDQPTTTLETPENTNPLPPSDGGGEDAEGVEETATAEPTPGDTAAVADSATATMTAFWDTSKPQQEWYNALAATMTPTGAEPHEYTLVENVQPAKLAGDPTVTWRTPDTAVATIPTNLGEYTLVVVRTTDGWRTESIGFPKED